VGNDTIDTTQAGAANSSDRRHESDRGPGSPGRGRTLALSAALIVTYVAASQGALLAFPHTREIAILWPSVGLTLAALLIWGPRLLPAAFLGCAFSEMLALGPLPSILVSSGLTTLTTGLAYALLVRIARIDLGLRRVHDVLALAVLGAALIAGLKVAGGALGALIAPGNFVAADLGPIAISAVAAGIAVLVITPVCITWYATRGEPIPVQRRLEAVLLAVTTIAVSVFVFGAFLSPMIAIPQLPYALFPLMFWAALRFGTREVATALSVVGLVAVACTAMEKGPFAMVDGHVDVVALHVFLVILGVTSLTLAAALAQRTTADAAVRDSEQRWRLLLERMNEGLVMQDRNGIMSYVSDRFCEITGYRRGELLGRTAREITVPEDRGGWTERHQQLQQGVSQSYELMLLKRNGERMDAYISPRPLFDERGTYTGSFALLTDVTERRRAEARLRESEAKFRLLVENQTDLILTLDRAGSVSFVSPSYRQIFGGDETALLGRPLALEIHEDDRTATARALAAAWHPPHAENLENRVMTPQGWRWLAWSVHPIRDANTEDEPAMLVAVARDVTDRRRAEEQAHQHLQSLAHVARVSSMGEMASAIAHEINQPLTAIANYAFACIRLLRAGKSTTDEALDVMQRVAAEAERAGEVVRKMRSFVRGDEGQLAAVDPNFLVAEVLRLAAPEARQSGVELVSTTAEKVTDVLADSIQIQQVLLNLVRNAVEAISGSDATERVVRVTTAPSGPGFVELVVSDTGPGLSTEALEKAFEPFYTTKPDGIGIGLALSRSIVEAHGGRLVAAAPAHGAEFRVRLPAVPEGDDD
jgi:PAS domain S-box-containing protein